MAVYLSGYLNGLPRESFSFLFLAIGRIADYNDRNYPVAANFRPSCSQALQRAFRKGKLDKHGRAYKVSESEMIHIKEFQERQRRAQEETNDENDGNAAIAATAAAAEEDDIDTKAEDFADNESATGSMDNPETDKEEDEEHTGKRERYVAVSEVSDGESSIFSTTATGGHGTRDATRNSNAAVAFDRAISINLGASIMTDSSAGLESLEATEEDTAAIVAAVTATDMDLTSGGDEIDVDDSHDTPPATLPALLMRADSETMSNNNSNNGVDADTVVDVEIDEIEEMVDVGTEADMDGDAAVSARTAPTRHHRNQRKGKRPRQASDAHDAASGDPTRPMRRRMSAHND
jgi:hypothetical protein